MASLSTLNVNCYRRVVPSAAANSHLPPEYCFTINASGFHTSQNLSHKYKLSHKKTSRVTEIRVATVEQDDSTDNQCHDAVNNIEDPIEYITTLLKTMGDGRESVSAYDTAWVAMIKDLQGGDGPQFPASLEWIVQNQLGDGSWGDDRLFCIYDRLVNTIACVVALATWKVHPHKLTKGVRYIKENVEKLEDGNVEHMTCGFELVFPAHLQRAKALGIQDLPYDDPLIQEIYHTREKKLEKTPREMMHKVETCLLYSLEGLEDLELEWDKLLKLQKPDGSFLTSISSTAFAFIKTNDHKCLHFITKTLRTGTFNNGGGAPNAYPVDIFVRLWAIDRLQRLGISRFFHSEIADCLDYVHRFWTDKGVFSGRESEFCDIDDTSMGIRLLRMHGFHVDPNMLRNFKQGEKFSCYGGQMFESPSPIFNLYRASQLQFPGEEILEEANKFAYQFLQQKLATNQLLDKWFRSKHLVDEIRTGLEMPWYASLPRVEARYYIQHYGGSSDVWIGKTLYRLPEICNDKYRELAVKDFKICQDQHQLEWITMQEWHASCNVEELGISRKELLLAYFLATASIFEPERAKERIAWAKSQILAKMIASFFNKETTSLQQKQAFLSELRKTNATTCKIREDGFALATLTQFLSGFDRYTSHQLKDAWIVWLTKLLQGEANCGADAELFTNTINICAGHIASREEILSSNEYMTLSNLTSKICQQLLQIQRQKTKTAKCSIKNMELEQDMQALVKLVLEKSGGIDRNIKNIFLQVAQTYYYTAYYDVETIDTHMFEVLFEPVA